MPRQKRTSQKRPRSVLQVSTTSAASPLGLPAGAFLLFGGLCLLVAGWGIWLILGWMNGVLFTENARFELQKVEARTDGKISEDLIREWTELELGTNLYDVDLPALRKRLESHAIVRRALVRRRLPDQIEVAVNERVPIARMGRVDGRLNWLLDRDGVVIQKSFQSKHLPFIVGIPSNVTLGDTVDEGRASYALACIEDLREMPPKMRDLLQIRAISIGNPDYLDVRSHDGFQLLLPLTEEYEDHWTKASRTIDDLLRSNNPNRKINLTPKGLNVIVGPK